MATASNAHSKKDDSFFAKLGTIGRKKKGPEIDDGKTIIEQTLSLTGDPDADLSTMVEGEERFIVDPTSEAEPKVQELVQTLMEWVTGVLREHRIIVKDARQDFYDGQVFQKLIEELSQTRVPAPEVSQSEIGQKQKLRVVLEYINRALEEADERQQGAQPKWTVDLIHSKNLVAILRLLVAMARHFDADIRLPDHVTLTVNRYFKKNGTISSRETIEDVVSDSDYYRSSAGSRDAFDTLFAHAPDKLATVKKMLLAFVNKHLAKLHLEIQDLDKQILIYFSPHAKSVAAISLIIKQLHCTVFENPSVEVERLLISSMKSDDLASAHFIRSLYPLSAATMHQQQAELKSFGTELSTNASGAISPIHMSNHAPVHHVDQSTLLLAQILRAQSAVSQSQLIPEVQPQIPPQASPTQALLLQLLLSGALTNSSSTAAMERPQEVPIAPAPPPPLVTHSDEMRLVLEKLAVQSLLAKTQMPQVSVLTSPSDLQGHPHSQVSPTNQPAVVVSPKVPSRKRKSSHSHSDAPAVKVQVPAAADPSVTSESSSLSSSGSASPKFVVPFYRRGLDDSSPVPVETEKRPSSANSSPPVLQSQLAAASEPVSTQQLSSPQHFSDGAVSSESNHQSALSLLQAALLAAQQTPSNAGLSSPPSLSPAANSSVSRASPVYSPSDHSDSDSNSSSLPDDGEMFSLRALVSFASRNHQRSLSTSSSTSSALSGFVSSDPTSSVSPPLVPHKSGRRKSAKSGSKAILTVDKRRDANARERIRVHQISACFEDLRGAIPSFSNHHKLSKLAILKIASAYILTLGKLVGRDFSTNDFQRDMSAEDAAKNYMQVVQESQGKGTYSSPSGVAVPSSEPSSADESA